MEDDNGIVKGDSAEVYREVAEVNFFDGFKVFKAKRDRQDQNTRLVRNNDYKIERVRMCLGFNPEVLEI